jgi:hypothetical protein
MSSKFPQPGSTWTSVRSTMRSKLFVGDERDECTADNDDCTDDVE